MKYDTSGLFFFFLTLFTGTLTTFFLSICDLTFVSKQYKAKLHQHQRFRTSWEAVCIRIKSKYYSKIKITKTNKKTLVLWRVGRSKHRVIPCMLMKRGWKYPLKSQKGGEGTSLKEQKLGALANLWNIYWEKLQRTQLLATEMLAQSVSHTRSTIMQLQFWCADSLCYYYQAQSCMYIKMCKAWYKLSSDILQISTHIFLSCESKSVSKMYWLKKKKSK